MAGRAAAGIFIVGVLVSGVTAWGQQGCQPPPRLLAQGENMFNEEQEEALGDIMADQVVRHLRTSTDPAVVAYLNGIVTRLVKHLPEAQLKVQVALVDLPEANAFTSAGGRIYVGQKMAALARNEDEVAGVLAHELGHAVTHQAAVEITRRMKLVLGVDHVGDRRDVISKYNQLLDNWRRNPKLIRRAGQSESEKQSVADRVGLYAVAAAGYSPEASQEIFDRFTGLQGKTGSWLSDLFAATKPEAKRLREIANSVSKLPSACVEKRPAGGSDEFKKWQSAVIEFTAWNQDEILHSVAARTVLTPKLRDRLRYLRFSPDGRYILAQDSGQIYILTKEPLQNLFQIDAPDALEAHFSPDSQWLVFNDRNLRVEKWDLTTRKRSEAHELVIYPPCRATALSPDGRYLACQSSDHSLRVTEVASGNEIFRKKDFTPGLGILETFFTDVVFGDPGFQPLLLTNAAPAFSPDGRYLLGRGKYPLAYDLTQRKEVSLRGPLGSLKKFAFLAPDRILVGEEAFSPKAEIVSFPDGQVLSKVVAPVAAWQAATRGDYIIWHPRSGAKVAAFSLTSGDSILSSKVLTAMDLYDQTLVSEARDGEIGLIKVESRQLIAQVALPSGFLSGYETVAASPNLGWLAVSNNERGAIWELSKGARAYHIRGFRGAYMPDESACYAEFPKSEEIPHTIEYVSLTSQSLQRVVRLDSEYVWNYGSVYILPKWEGGQPRSGAKLTLEVYDARLGKLLWSREFSKVRPGILMRPGTSRMGLLWKLSTREAEDEVKRSPLGGQKLGSETHEKGDYFVEVVEAKTGDSAGALVVGTGNQSFNVEGGFASDDWVVLADNVARLHIYSLVSGEEEATLFGERASLSQSARFLAAQNGQHLTLFDLAALEERDDFTFQSPIVFTQFSSDGNRLLALTRDQTAYTLNVGGSLEGEKIR